jgi:outer membrane lipoprotein carrier protein
MIRTIALICAVVATPGWSSTPTPTATTAPTKASVVKAGSLPTELKAIELGYQKAKTMKADFVQTTWSKVTNSQQITSGTLLFRQPNKIRWIQIKPDPLQLISDGKTFWFYTPPFDESEPGEVRIRKTSEVQSQIANQLLAGKFGAARFQSIKKSSSTEFVLIPRRGSAGTISEILLKLSIDGTQVQSLEIKHSTGNKSQIQLQNLVLGAPAGDSDFVFVVPPKTKVSRE